MHFRNRRLDALPASELDLLPPHLTRVRLSQRQSLGQAGRPIEFVCFPEDALVSSSS
ncbi:MAG TPA: hypothetical protein VEA99_18000 [Gemmatimonadaceae bacterium]|nr:hypothetical protein [Gemmatimonadaceae bacterium]